MRILTADFIFPVSGPPIANGYLIVDDDGSIVDLKQGMEIDPENLEKHRGILVPGFINTHCHLDLSYLKGKLAPGWGLDTFIRDLRAQNQIPVTEEEKILAAEAAEVEMKTNGIVGVSDISSDDHTLEVKKHSRLAYYSFCEAYGSDPEDAKSRFEQALTLYNKVISLPGQAGATITPHSTYSVSPELFKLIKTWVENKGTPLSIHHQENNDENRYFQNKGGPIVSRMHDFGVDIRTVHPRRMRPIPALMPYLPVNNRILLVHNTVSTPEDINFIMENLRDAWFCLCPNANLYIENSLPNIPFFRPYRDKITLGTDSLASNNSLSILEEMKAIQEYYPEVNLQEMIQWGTLNGARFLGMDSWAGNFEKGKKPGVNLLQRVIHKTFTLTAETTVKVLV